jgi:predicted DNA-binding protein with PD1-like motif
VVVFDKDDEVMGGLTAFAEEQGLSGGCFFALGALSGARLAYFDRREKRYLPIEVGEQVEVTALVPLRRSTDEETGLALIRF